MKDVAQYKDAWIEAPNLSLEDMNGILWPIERLPEKAKTQLLLDYIFNNLTKEGHEIYRFVTYLFQLRRKKYGNYREQLNKLLFLIAPGVPNGQGGKGLTHEEAAKVLGISKRTIQNLLAWFKINMPKEYDNYDAFWRVARRERESLRWKTGFEGKSNPFDEGLNRGGGVSLGSNLYEMEKLLEQSGHSIKGKF